MVLEVCSLNCSVIILLTRSLLLIFFAYIRSNKELAFANFGCSTVIQGFIVGNFVDIVQEA